MTKHRKGVGFLGALICSAYALGAYTGVSLGLGIGLLIAGAAALLVLAYLFWNYTEEIWDEEAGSHTEDRQIFPDDERPSLRLIINDKIDEQPPPRTAFELDPRD